VEHAVTRTTVVLVEDDEDTLEAFSILLGEKYRVVAYRSGLEAVRAIDAAKPDVLLLDIGMAPVDGVQCLEAIRARPAYRDLPAVALTGFARDVECERFIAVGFQAVVVKPVMDHQRLMAVIDRLVSARRTRAPQTSMDPGRAPALLGVERDDAP
jgi:CheY-like chemotaxis protein